VTDGPPTPGADGHNAIPSASRRIADTMCDGIRSLKSSHSMLAARPWYVRQRDRSCTTSTRNVRDCANSITRIDDRLIVALAVAASGRARLDKVQTRTERHVMPWPWKRTLGNEFRDEFQHDSQERRSGMTRVAAAPDSRTVSRLPNGCKSIFCCPRKFLSPNLGLVLRPCASHLSKIQANDQLILTCAAEHRDSLDRACE